MVACVIVEFYMHCKNYLNYFLSVGKSQYGDVFLAKAGGIRAGEIETQVVVKSLFSKEDHHFYEFQREMEMYSRLDHNNVIKLLGVCRETEPQFYIAEYCDWVSARENWTVQKNSSTSTLNAEWQF